MKKAYKATLLILIMAIFFMLCGGAILLNGKLNRSHRGIINALSSLEKRSDSSSTIENNVTDKSEARQGPVYDFASIPSETLEPYDPRGKYYSSGGDDPSVDTVDADGVLLTFRKELDGDSYHPVAIAQYGLGQFSNYVVTGSDEFLAEARAQADWLAGQIMANDGYLYYDFDFDVIYNEPLKTPWASAMAQGLAISLLARFYDQTGEDRYLSACTLAMEPLVVPVSQGGLLEDFFGRPFYEEYPTKLPNYTLNGFMFTLIGLLDLWKITGDDIAEKLYRDGIETLIFSLPFFDSNGISLYWLTHLNGTGVPVHYAPKYHLIHIKQLQALNQFEDNSVISHYIEAWIGYVTGE